MSVCGEASGVRSTVSYSQQPEIAAKELRESLANTGLGFVLFFCSAEYDLVTLGQMLDKEFGEIPVVGCTTAGELTPDGYGQGCITAIGFCDQNFSITSQLIQEIEHFSFLDAQNLVSELLDECKVKGIAPVKGHTFALTLLDGLASLEERVLAALNSAFGSIPNFGGSAGDDEHLAYTHVYFRGQFHNNAAVIVLVNTYCDFEVFTTHHMNPLDNKLVVTKADCEQRRVYEFNAEPAADAYADAVGVPVEELNSLIFALKPIGVKIGEDYYLRSIQRVHEDKSLTFYCAIENGIVLTALEPGDMLADLENIFKRQREKVGEPQITIGCDCFLRRLEAEHLGIKDDASKFLKKHKVIGFNTYGEQIGGMHINQTFTGVSIGACRKR